MSNWFFFSVVCSFLSSVYHRQDFLWTWLWVTLILSYKKQSTATVCEHLGSSPGFRVARFLFCFGFFCIRCVSCAKFCQCFWFTILCCPFRSSSTFSYKQYWYDVTLPLGIIWSCTWYIVWIVLFNSTSAWVDLTLF